MSTKTKQEVMAKLTQKYVGAGAEYRVKLIDQVVELTGCHRKSAIRALNKKPRPKKARAPGIKTGRPREYHGDTLLPILKPIWFASNQPCGCRLRAMLPEWIPAYEADHCRLDRDVRRALLSVSARSLDRLLAPLRASCARRSATRPGTMLRQSIPIRGMWDEEGPGWVEMDTVAMCGGTLDDLHLWMLDVVDIHTHWIELRALANRGQHSTCEQIDDIEKCLPFALLGADCDNGGEFINHHLVRFFAEREKPVFLTRSRPYQKNDNAHVEQRNSSHIRAQFGHDRYDNPQVVELINALCKGALGQMNNHFFCTLKLKEKRRREKKITRIYGPAESAYERVLQASQVKQKIKAQLRAEHATLNPFQLAREIEAKKKIIEAHRRLRT
jgi:5S rRNA maturation endonuclease (ribonuclease M5)